MRVAAPLILLALLAIQVMAGPGITAKETYRLGESIDLEIPSGITARLEIEAPDAKYRLLSPPEGIEPFTPKVAGNYTVNLYDAQNVLLMTGKFLVLEEDDATTHSITVDPLEPHVDGNATIRIHPVPAGEIEVTIFAPQGKFRYAGPWQDASFVPRDAGEHEIVLSMRNAVIGKHSFRVRETAPDLISTSKTSYGPGEEIVVHAAQGVGEDWYLLLTSGTRSSKYFGTERTIRFSPAESGKQVIRAVSTMGEILDELIVEAAEPGIASHSLLLEAHDGRHRIVGSRIEESGNGREVVVENLTNAVQRIRLRGLQDGPLPSLRIEDVPTGTVGRESVQAYAIDPVSLEFSNATVTAIAQGRQLYKCTEYWFGNRTCYGAWKWVRGIEPGEEYSFLLTREDPLFSESNSSGCSCADSVTSQNAGTLSCNVFCPHTIDIPSGAIGFHLQQIRYDVTVTITQDSTTTSNGNHNGWYDHDQDASDADNVLAGSSTTTSTATLVWTNSTVPATGARSFTDADCSNWPDYCNYYVYLNSSIDFQAPGNSRKSPSINISLTSINYTIDYTVPGPFSVILNSPAHDTVFGNLDVPFNYTPTTERGSLLNCTLYTNATSWSAKNETLSPANATINTLLSTVPGDGHYAWNVLCQDDLGGAWAIANRTVIVDTTPPLVNLLVPASGTTETGTNVVTFTYNVSDENPIGSCSLKIDGEPMQSDGSITRNSDQEFTHNLLNGFYNWTVACLDDGGNSFTAANRTLNVSVPIAILDGTWYETDTQDCTGWPCGISAAQQTDGTANSVSDVAPASSTTTMTNATSAYIGSNGGVLQAGSTVDFSTHFQSVSGGNMEVNWHLFVLHTDGDLTPVCSDVSGTGASSGAASAGSCAASSTVRMESTDRFSYRIDMENTHPNQARTIDHTIDHANSFFDATNFTQIGTLSVGIATPLQEFQILQGDSFLLACNITCVGGTCQDVAVNAQTNASGSWTAIGGGGVLTLNGSETNPHNIGDVFNGTSQTQFAINASTAGTGDVRCSATSRFQNAASGSTRVGVQNNQAPSIALSAPANDTWNNAQDLTFSYIPSTLGTLDNCTFYLDGLLNQTDTTPANGIPNGFVVEDIPEGLHIWNITCTDVAGLQGWSETWNVRIDRNPPYRIDLNGPPDGSSTPSPNVNFNWTAYDLLAPSLTCDLVIDGTVNETILSSNATSTNVTVAGFGIGTYAWRVDCTDPAGNTNSSPLRNFTVFDQPPLVDLASPGNASAVNTTLVVFEYNASDNFGLTECALYINGEHNQTNQTPLTQGTNSFTQNLQEESYNWSVTCIDNNMNNASDGNWTFRVDTTRPLVDLDSPTNNSIFNLSQIQFIYTATDISPILACTIFVDGLANISSTAASGIAQSETEGGYPDGDHSWNVTCLDAADNANTSETRLFVVNETPRIEQVSPEGNAHLRGDFNLTYLPDDNDGFAGCRLFLNGEQDQENASQVFSGREANFSMIGRPEGEYNWSVTCTDGGIYQNANTTINLTFIIDNTPPGIILDYPPDTEIIDRDFVNFSWIATDNLATGLSCDLSINGVVNASDIASGNGGITNWTVTGFLSGEYDWNVICTDNATNTNTSETRNFTIRVPPRVNLVSPENDTHDVLSAVTFTYVPSSGTGIYENCTLSLDGTINQTNQTPVIADMLNSFSVSGLDQGRHDWNVACTDTNGLSGSGEGRTYYFDLTSPAVFTYTPANESIVTRNNVSFTFSFADSLSPNATCDLYLEDAFGTFPILQNQPVANGTNYTHYRILGDGQYSWNATCIDLAGNFNQSLTFDFIVDAPPNVTLLQPPNSTWSNTGDVTFTYLPEDDVQIKNCTLFINNTQNGTDAIIQRNQNNDFTPGNFDQGIYDWTVGCYDADDNFFEPKNFTLYVDKEAPLILLNDPANGQALTTSLVLMNYTPQDNLAHNLTCDIAIDGIVNRTDIVGNGNHLNATVGPFVDGSFSWNVTCADNAQNTNTSVTWNFTVQEPPMVLLSGPMNGTRTANTSLNFSYIPDDNSHAITSCLLELDGQPDASNATPILLQQENDITGAGLVDGTYLWDINCADPGGNQGTNGTPYTIYIDLLGPQITLRNPAEGETFNTNNISFNWTAEDFEGTSIACDLSVSNQTNGPIAVSGLQGLSGSDFFSSIADLSDGGHAWNVTCTDDLGNTNTSLTGTFTINQPDLFLDGQGITFSNPNPGPNEEIDIRANVSNIGGVDAIGANVSFWDGNPLSGGTYLGSSILTVSLNGSRIFSIPWNITDGFHTVHISADPNDLIAELEEENNNATATISRIKVNITYPGNGTVTADSTSRLDFNMTDFAGGILNYSIYVDGAFNGQTGSVADASNTTLNLPTLADGTHEVIVEAEDGLGRKRNSTPLHLTVDTTPPKTVFLTANDSWHATGNVLVEFNLTDATDTLIGYTLYFDGTENRTGVSVNASLAQELFEELAEGSHSVIIETVDDLGNAANSTGLFFTVDTTPPNASILTGNETWFGTPTPTIDFNITDNLDTLLEYSLFVDGSFSINGTVANASTGTRILSTIAEGSHTIIVEGADEAGHRTNSTPITIYVDTTPPNVTLLAPPNGTNLTRRSITLNWTGNDNLASGLACDVQLDGASIDSLSVAPGVNHSTTASALSGGTHIWNVTCIDDAGNAGFSETWQFFVALPDLAIAAGNITFSDPSPIENQTISVNAIISNNGSLDATNITIQFWLGDPDLGGTQIGEEVIPSLDVGETWNSSTNHTAIIGLNQLFVIIDPPLSSNGTIQEEDEGNNRANRDFWVGLFEVFAGTSDSTVRISDASITSAFTWNQTNVTGSNVFVVDSDSSLAFTELHAIGRNRTGGVFTGSNDFEEIDIRLNTSLLNDSINLTFTSSGQPKGMMSIVAFGRLVEDIPVVNSTNTSSFRTGILWDASDGGAYYDGSQDITFATVMNLSKQGKYGTYDYEIRIPARLREYLNGGTTVSFYTELR